MTIRRKQFQQSVVRTWGVGRDCLLERVLKTNVSTQSLGQLWENQLTVEELQSAIERLRHVVPSPCHLGSEQSRTSWHGNHYETKPPTLWFPCSREEEVTGGDGREGKKKGGEGHQRKGLETKYIFKGQVNTHSHTYIYIYMYTRTYVIYITYNMVIMWYIFNYKCNTFIYVISYVYIKYIFTHTGWVQSWQREKRKEGKSVSLYFSLDVYFFGFGFGEFVWVWCACGCTHPCECGRAHLCKCGCSYPCECAWRSEVNISCLSKSLSTLFFLFLILNF